MLTKNELRPIKEIAEKAGIDEKHLIPYGRHIAKIDASIKETFKGRPKGALILVTGMNPIKAGDGKTTLTIGLTQSLNAMGRRAIACIRQPSLGPLFGAKGGATGGGLARALPVEDISLQFTGDDDAVTNANNLVAALVDNHIYHGNGIGIDPARIAWRRTAALSDRTLRNAAISLGSAFERKEEFRISAASEIMSILCLAKDLADVKKRISGVLVGFDRAGKPVFAEALGAVEAPAALLRNAVNPNLVQSTEGSPVFIHTGPFGNISLGCSSATATNTALHYADYVLTEAGFSTELGAEKFFDILCREGGLRPAGAIIVATLGALRIHGTANLKKHCANVALFGLPSLVVINKFADDSPFELKAITDELAASGIISAVADVFNKGGAGGIEAAEAVSSLFSADTGRNFRYLYDLNSGVIEKLERIATMLYGAEGVELSEQARADLDTITANSWTDLPVCVAKTPRSLSDDPKLIGVPTGFKLRVGRIVPALGAGLLIAICGNIVLMPGLPPHPNSENIRISESGDVSGL